jgi:hypothetical protein
MRDACSCYDPAIGRTNICHERPTVEGVMYDSSPSALSSAYFTPVCAGVGQWAFSSAHRDPGGGTGKSPRRTEGAPGGVGEE